MKESISFRSVWKNYNFEFHCIIVFMLVKLLQCHNSFIYRVPCMLVHLWCSCTCMILYIIFIHTHLWCNFIFFILQDTFLILPHKIIEKWKCRLWIWCKAIGKRQCQEVSWVYQRFAMNLKYVEPSCAWRWLFHVQNECQAQYTCVHEEWEYVIEEHH